MSEFENQREFHRGEVWWFRDVGAYGTELGNSRPGVIVSSERGCETSPNLQIVMTTTSPNKYGVINVPLEVYKGRKQTAMCGTLFTYSKERADTYLYTVTPEQMAEIDRGLAVVLGMHSNDPQDDSVEKLEEENASMKVEIAMYQKLYEKAVDQLATMKLGFDLGKRTEKAAPPKKPEVRVSDPGFEPVDINRCSVDELKSIGVSLSLAQGIVNGRPYMKVEDMKKVPGITGSWFNVMSKKVTVGDVSEFLKKKPEPLNINECSFGELSAQGLSDNIAASVIAGRPYMKVEDLKAVPGINEKFYEKLSEVAVVGDMRVNINTATAAEISQKTGLTMTVAYGIAGHRKRNGLYKSVDELLEQPKFTEYHMKKYGHLLCV